MSAHRALNDLALGSWVTNFDPAIGNTTVAAGKLSTTANGEYRLIASQASTQEERTLPDPLQSGLILNLVLYKTAGAALRVSSVSKLNYAGQTHMLFGAVDQVVMLQSVPYLNGTTSQFRWEIMMNDGASLS